MSGMNADLSSGASGRAATTKLRHGEEFYARIGRKSQELRRLARAGDAAALDVLTRRRAARADRRHVWEEVLEAREAVRVLRDELHSSIRANNDACRAFMVGRYTYTGDLRRELDSAEMRLQHLEARHQEVLNDLRSALPADQEGVGATP